MIEITDDERINIQYALYRQYRKQEQIRELINTNAVDSQQSKNRRETLLKEEGIFFGMVRMLKTFGFAIKQYKNGTTDEMNFEVAVVSPFTKLNTKRE